MAEETSNQNNPRASGCLLALTCLLGAGVGSKYLHSPSLGILLGLGVGLVIALILWWLERSRSRHLP